MHFGGPVVPDEYITNKGWLKGSCLNSNRRDGFACRRNSISDKLYEKNKLRIVDALLPIPKRYTFDT